MALNSRVKWSIAILVIVALSFPVFLLMRGNSMNIYKSGDIKDANEQIYTYTTLYSIKTSDNDIIYMDITSNVTLMYRIVDTPYNISAAPIETTLFEDTIEANNTAHLEFPVAEIHEISIQFRSLYYPLKIHISYFQQTEVKGFYIWLIFLGVVLVVINLGSFLIPNPAEEIPSHNNEQ
ncbi:MAG: hypothetical protein K9W44_06435 [Candidatus Lokiarchaeota archaeon]|nr:hypothetical protein [Candidatus Harpocratesius repetitus]